MECVLNYMCMYMSPIHVELNVKMQQKQEKTISREESATEGNSACFDACICICVHVHVHVPMECWLLLVP